jgi:hypothetical protein
MAGFKVKCTFSRNSFTKDKTYNVTNGKLIDDDGDLRPTCMETFENFEQLYLKYPYFELVTEEFTKADLKTGMRVEFRNGDKYIYVDSSAKGFVRGSCSTYLENYSDDLKYDREYNQPQFDIVKVFEEPKYLIDMFSYDCETPLIWKRQEPRDFTKQEAARILSEYFDEVVTVEGVKA